MITVWKCEKCQKINLLENGNICQNLSCKFDLQMSENMQIEEISMDEYIKLNGIEAQSQEIDEKNVGGEEWKCEVCFKSNTWSVDLPGSFICKHCRV